MPAPDARTRTKIPLSPVQVLSNSIPPKQLSRIFLSDTLFILSLYAGKEWLLEYDIGVFWVVIRVLACGGLGMLTWAGVTGGVKRKSIENIEWSVLGTASLLLFVQQTCLFTALYRLSSTRVALFSHFSTLWIGTFLSPSSAVKITTVSTAFIVSLIFDTQMSATAFWRYIPGYGALILHGITSSGLDQTLEVLVPSLGNTFTAAVTIVGAFIFAFPFYVFGNVMLGFPSTPVLPLSSLAVLPVISYALLLLIPLTMKTMKTLNNSQFMSQHFRLSYPFIVILSVVIAALLFVQSPSWTDYFVAVLLYFGMYPQHTNAFPVKQRTPTSKLMRYYLKTILSNPESRKIFYFLMLNMCYMLVQMLYGVWTNSLGLISDAIHMAFDCMAIGVGLFASIMATWEPNERFTYGYSRIETLSGFANGIFLILISIFIVFEAIQRILDPPEMNTSQLLLVSTLGLAVNLFGMFAMGGHHHHGSHSHSHSIPTLHGHTHSHTAVTPTLPSAPSYQHSYPPPFRHLEHAQPDINQLHSYPDTPTIILSDHYSKSSSVNSSVDARLPSLLIPEERTCEELSPFLPNLSRLPDLPTPLTPNHKPGHDDYYKEHEGHSHNMRGVFLHVLADTLGSVGVIVSTLLIQYYGWTGFDPIASLFIAILIAASVIPLVLDTGRILCLDVADRDATIHQVLASLASIEELSSYSAARFWPKDSTSLIGSIHIRLVASTSSYDLAGQRSYQQTYTRIDRVIERVDTILRNGIPGLEELTIQVGQ
ncbi:hypothetical protein AMATHDRAFT_70910 [Amanita thiersii Skay4041]|uniref:Cation efflux protein transmembrane domain-containing protein n=1 Tax=Amanita thiersii Skay4041 TaxID=703135 RepID=A0A2A9N7B6_9AGAR|nr:hypothetical protein AMATHDRAFT_70910 [Amanita thiersii Skay4041]